MLLNLYTSIDPLVALMVPIDLDPSEVVLVITWRESRIRVVAMWDLR